LEIVAPGGGELSSSRLFSVSDVYRVQSVVVGATEGTRLLAMVGQVEDELKTVVGIEKVSGGVGISRINEVGVEQWYDGEWGEEKVRAFELDMPCQCYIWMKEYAVVVVVMGSNGPRYVEFSRDAVYGVAVRASLGYSGEGEIEVASMGVLRGVVEDIERVEPLGGYEEYVGVETPPFELADRVSVEGVVSDGENIFTLPVKMPVVRDDVAAIERVVSGEELYRSDKIASEMYGSTFMWWLAWWGNRTLDTCRLLERKVLRFPSLADLTELWRKGR